MGGAYENRWNRLLRIVVALGLVSLTGTVGYHLLEGWPLLDALYMTVITLTTVGFGEVRQLDEPGRWFTIGLMVTSVGIVAYSATQLATLVVETEFRSVIWRRRMDKRIRALAGHYIVCGYGRTGEAVSQTLVRDRLEAIVIENDPDRVALLKEIDLPLVEGDATADECLQRAGIDRARGLVAALGNDAENVYLVLSARQLNPGLRIVSWADSREAEGKIRRAGADYVLSPYLLGGSRMVQYLIAPHALEFLDLAMRGEYHDIHLDEIELQPGSAMIGNSLKGMNVGRELGVIVIGIVGEHGDMVFNPSADYVFRERDTLIGIGSPSQFDKLRALV